MITDYEYVAPPIKNSAFAFTVFLTSKINPDTFVDNPTVVAGDVKISKDGGALVNLTYTPTVTGKVVKVSLTAAEMNANFIAILFSDAAGSQWQDMSIMIRTMLAVNDGNEVALEITDLNLYSGITFAETVSGLSIPSNWTKIYFTAKKKLADTDSMALVQILKSNPPDPGDGLLYLDGGVPITPTDGAMTVDQAGGTIDIDLTDDATAVLEIIQSATYDIKCITSDPKSYRLRGGNFIVALTETMALV